MDNGEVIQVGATKPTEWNRQQYRVYSPSGLSPCLNTVQGGGLEPKIVCEMEEVKIISSPHGFNKGGEKDIAPACTSSAYQNNNFVVEPKIIQKFGDRGTSQYSVRDMAHTIPANPMSDRGQMVVQLNDWKSVVGNKQMNPFRGSVDGESPCITSACGAGGGNDSYGY